MHPIYGVYMYMFNIITCTVGLDEEGIYRKPGTLVKSKKLMKDAIGKKNASPHIFMHIQYMYMYIASILNCNSVS